VRRVHERRQAVAGVRVGRRVGVGGGLEGLAAEHAG
jgi:hypothetical protein